MSFTIKGESNLKKPQGSIFELLQHNNGQLGVVIGKLNPQKEVKVAIFDKECLTNYGCWRLIDTQLSDKEILISNQL